LKIFISSVIGGYESFRKAAAEAIGTLGHQVIRSEDFSATPDSPQIACLAGIRQADAVVVLLGARYGPVQGSGMSATHEEFREARATKPTLAFLQDGITPDTKQAELIKEARDWSGGGIAPAFGDADDLKAKLIRGLHELELSRAAGTAEPGEMLNRARGLVPASNSVNETCLVLALASGPRLPILRPTELADRQLARDLMQDALFGDAALLDAADGTSTRIHGSVLSIDQARARIAIDVEGSITIVRPTHRDRGWDGSLTALIDEDIKEDLDQGLRFADRLLERIDPTRRLTHVAPVAALLRGTYMAWRTRAEHAASPHSMTMNMGGGDEVLAVLAPPSRPRPALHHQASELAADLAAVLRRNATERQ
jgi:Domain of unknown function (DUF4062)